MKRSNYQIAKTLLISGLIFSTYIGTIQAAQPSYKLTDLGALTTTGSSAAVDINNHGQIVGYSWAAGQQTSATIWDKGQISLLGGHALMSSATAINDSGVVVGYNETSSGQNAVVWTNGQATILDSNTATALDINSHGVIAGATYNSGPTIWINGTMEQLPIINSYYFSVARGINNLGQVVGSYELTTADWQIYTRAALWSNGNGIDIGAADGFSSSYAEKINDAGDIVGQSHNGFNGGAHATLWRNGVAIDLGSLNDGTEASFAMDINSHGQIVGYSQSGLFSPENNARAVIWFADLNPVMLDTLIDPLDPLYGQVSLYTAKGINDLGQIVGYGLINGKERAFLLSPLATVPEPGSMAMLLAGLGLFGIASRRNKQA
jgi:probable HAF family extracellular repeat protein